MIRARSQPASRLRRSLLQPLNTTISRDAFEGPDASPCLIEGLDFGKGCSGLSAALKRKSQPDAIHPFHHKTSAHLFAPALSKMDRQSAFSVSVFGNRDGPNEDSRSQIQEQLVNFILGFRIDNKFIYR